MPSLPGHVMSKFSPDRPMVSTVQYSTVQYSTVQYSTVQYSTVQKLYSNFRLLQYCTCPVMS